MTAPQPVYLEVPFGPLSVLQAVNVLISTLGESEVETVSATTESVQALSRLNEADLDLQSKSWSWNREYGFQTTLSADGTVALPANTLIASLAYGQSQNWTSSPFSNLVPDTGQPTRVVLRGNRLYNPDASTYVFPAAPILDLTVRLSWDLLPVAAQQAIVYKAAQRFHARLQGDSIVIQVNTQDLRDAMATLEQYEDATFQANSVNGNVSSLGALYGTGGMRRNRGGL